MTKTIARVLHTALLLSLVPVTVGCGRNQPIGAAGTDSGEIGLALQLAPGTTLTTAAYAITGPGGFSKPGTLDLSHSNTLSTIVGGIPAGGGYSVTITAMATGLGCSGSAPFSVTAHAITNVVVPVRCQEAPQNGSVLINGVLNVCPLIDELSASPAEIMVGSPLTLTAAAHDSDAVPQPVSYQWTAPSGSFANASAATTSFTCGTPGAVVVTLTVSDGDCSDTLTTTITCAPAGVYTVAATVETDPVAHAGDAADDPAIWVNPADPALSTVIGTDKTADGGLGVYDLAGHQLQFVAAGALNNVDLRTGFPLGGAAVALVTAGNRTNNSIAMFKIDPATRLLSDVAARTITTLATYGSCMYRSPVTGKFYYFVDAKTGEIEQWELFDNGAGLVDATKIRNLRKLDTQPEACVTDDELGFFYIGEEDVGIWKFNAEPNANPADPLTNGVLVDGTGPGGHLVADVEGLAIARTGAGTGFLIAANQGNSTYAIYTREGSNSYLKTFQVGTGPACIDEVTGSDGIDVTTAPLGPAFPSGVFVTQDDTNGPSGNQNFKLVPLQDILNGPGAAPAMCVPPATGSGGAGGSSGAGGAGGMSMSGGGGAGGAPAGNPAEFCDRFCGKCNGCWDPAGGFSEGDCLYQLSKPNFSLTDCLTGCSLGRTPAFPIANLVPNWESLSCLDFDASM